MSANRLLLAATFALASATSLFAQSPSRDADLLALGHKMTEWFYTFQADSLVAHFNPESREQLGGLAGVQEEVARFFARAGTEQHVIEEKMTRRKGQAQYWREATFDGFTAEPLVIRWVFDDQGQVTGVGMGPKSQTPPVD
jgi:hypothetical protein